MTATPLDAAFLAQEAAPERETPRLRFQERLLDSELFLLLEIEPIDTNLTPRIFDIEEGRFVLAFDRDDRLAAFLDAPAPYAAIPGRRLVEMLTGQGIGIGLNLGDFPSATLLPAGLIDWMAERAATATISEADLPDQIAHPTGVSPELIAALDPKLARMADVIEAAWLVHATAADGTTGLLLALTGVPDAAQSGVTRAIAETLAFGTESHPLDIAFVAADAAALPRLAKLGLGFDLPRPEPVKPPGTDPSRPPILR